MRTRFTIRQLRTQAAAFIACLMLCLVAPTAHRSAAYAEDAAHGGDSALQADQMHAKPGEAVKAQRKTERYTEKGMTVDPVAFDIAPNGDVYVAEGSRAGGSVIDNRNAGLRRSNGVINDLQKTSVEDRLDQIKMLIEGGFYPQDTFTKDADRVRLVKDTNGDGKADTSSIFADGFNDPLDGIASGVLYHDGKVYLTNIPHLWLLEDKDGDGDADKETPGERTSLSYGWGIRWAFYGHDMHGLIKGPDGRIYFSIGDRGYNVTTKEGKHLYGPDRGAVFRMWPDGSELELYFEGLRNPQELAFDNYGNLFTGDNNSDSGDKARFAYLPEGGDAGWRQDVQSLNDRGPWNREHMWKPRDVEKFGLDQPAWIIPPLANVGRGPSGLTHYPGTGDAFPTNGSFLMCDYPSGVRHVHVKPDGAMFKVVEDSQLPVEGSTITDVTWGYDGRLYLSDWGGGWNPNPNGYIKTMVNEAAHKEQAEVIAEVKSLFAGGFDKLSDEKLIDLLGHADQRVRIHAQWEAADRGTESIRKKLSIAMVRDQSDLTRLHALWTMTILCRNGTGDIADIWELFEQPYEEYDSRIRAQAIWALGELRDDYVANASYLHDLSPEVRYHAAIALGKTGTAKHIGPLLDLLDRNDNEDVAIRHAASYGLSLIGDADKIASEMKRRGSAARLGGVLALRRLDSPLLADFLNDDHPTVAAEAARAIYDKRIMDALPALAALLETLPAERMSEPVMRRVIEANVRLADQASAVRLGRLASNNDAPEQWRQLALQELDSWANERNRDGVWGWWWPRPEQTMDDAIAALQSHLSETIEHSTGDLLVFARLLDLKYLRRATPDTLAAILRDSDEANALRLAALKLLSDQDRDLASAIAGELASSSDVPAPLRQSLREQLWQIDRSGAAISHVWAIDNGTVNEQQQAIMMLARIKAADMPESVQYPLPKLADQLVAGELAPELQLEVVRVFQGRGHLPEAQRDAVREWVASKQKPDEGPFIREAVLAGGDIMRGKDIFLHQDVAQCQRCHNADGSDGVGPGLTTIGSQFDVNYLYDALVKPSRDIAKGYAPTSVKLKSGNTLTGRIIESASDAQTLVLANADGEQTTIQRSNIVGSPVTSQQSQMPTMIDKLSPAELRDVLAYLVSLQGDPSSSGPTLVNPAKGMSHTVWLAGMLLTVAAGLGLLLLMTVLGARAKSIHGSVAT